MYIPLYKILNFILRLQSNHARQCLIFISLENSWLIGKRQDAQHRHGSPGDALLAALREAHQPRHRGANQCARETRSQRKTEEGWAGYI